MRNTEDDDQFGAGIHSRHCRLIQWNRSIELLVGSHARNVRDLNESRREQRINEIEEVLDDLLDYLQELGDFL